jgi:RNA polymerase sigma-70 factor (ECF subfamily)
MPESNCDWFRTSRERGIARGQARRPFSLIANPRVEESRRLRWSMTKSGNTVTVTPAAGVDGSPSPEETLVRTFNALRDELISTLMYLLGNREDAQDAAQDAFVKCWGARARLHQVLNLRAWIFRVGYNTAKDVQRSAWARRVKPLTGEEIIMLMANQAGPAEVLEKKESVERLRRAILDLREEEKEVFLLRQNGELTYEQIAEVRRCPVGTVKTQMRSALEKLRKILV